MKTRTLTLFITAFSLSAATLFLPSCGDTKANDKDKQNLTTEAGQLQVPYLKGRKPGLGTPDEVTHVAGIYDAKKAMLKKDPNNPESYLKLAELFMNEARITGDHPYYYPAALQMIAAIPNLATQKEDVRFEAAYYKSSVLLSMHEFQKALVEGENARMIFPQNAGIHGVLIDANVELGNYEEAVRLSDIMVGMRPDLRSYSRVSYLREIHGDPKGAIEAMLMAVDAAMPGYEQSAWCRLTLAKLYETYGQLDEAKMHYSILLQERPDYPFAYAGLASVAMKQGSDKDADALLDKAIALIPEVGFYEQKAEILLANNRPEEAASMVQEILKMMQEDQASGHQMDLELAAVQLRLANDPAAAQESAEKALQARPNNIDVNAMLAEIAYTKGDFPKAQSYMKIAMRTQSQDPSKSCLAGLIEVQIGNKAAGMRLIKQAFAHNPYLDSPLAAKAKALL
jgi:tetratricopeptide (TPR) repeat protein